MKHLVWIFLAICLKSYSQTPGNGVTDINNKHYNSVIIKTQEWMKENLNVPKYSDGTPIPQAWTKEEWANSTTGAWCNFENMETYGENHGKLYNWYAVAGIYDEASKKDVRKRKKLAPKGWHIPSDSEWTTLTTFLGGEKVAGGKLKQKGNENWASPNTLATNSSGFTAIPGAGRSGKTKDEFNGVFVGSIMQNAIWWSSTEYSKPDSAWCRLIYFNSAIVTKGFPFKSNGFSVRCIKD
jgi:uncharacterized protein (TIGR02145 family)